MRSKPLSRHPHHSTTRLSVQQMEDRCLPSTYTLTDLGTLGGSPGGQAYAINEAGQVVGYTNTATSQTHAFLWTDGVMTDLGTFPTGSSSKAFGLNNIGQVVGYAFDGSPGGGSTNHAFLWQDGVMPDLVPSPEWSSASAINDSGQVAGTYNLNRPFIWENGVLTDLGGFGGSAPFGSAEDINNAGQVVGSSFVDNGSEGLSQRAFLWEDGVMTDLGTLPGLPDSRAYAINESGQIVGFSTFHHPETPDELYESFLYFDGVMIDLGVPGEGNIAYDINDSGQIVGWSVGGAYIYEDGVVIDLNTLIPAGSGLTLLEAHGINNAGQIVGVARDAASRSHAFLLTPVAAGTPTLSISDVTIIEGNAGTTNAVFTIRLSAASGEAVTVSFATSDGTASAGSDYAAHSGSITLAPGATTATVTVAVNGDRVGEPNEAFHVGLSAAAGALIADGQGVGTIVDDEPRLSISDATQVEGTAGFTLFVFTVSLSAPSDAPVTVSYATADGTATAGQDYIARSGTLTFAPGETSKTISVAVRGDRRAESNEAFLINLSAAQGALIVNSQGLGTILDDDGRL
jgi:probable HAF family extracellular repeat protein